MIIYVGYDTSVTPPMGDNFIVVVGIMGSEDPADSVYRNPKGRRLLRVPQFVPQNPAMGMLKSHWTQFRACVQRAFWRYHTCKHSQELTPWLLKL